ncbi:MAG: hypothetical protein QOI12_933 [Alphaproteobacteria bacterium]|jgi:hypothetical protein|nr:hypothetical protein [Alphaproteobacteria bacterium]
MPPIGLRSIRLAGIGLLAVAFTALPAHAQEGTKPSLPDTAACPQAVADIATCYSARHATGAYVFAAMPKSWNGHLVVFAHGGPSLVPYQPLYSQADLAKYSIAVKRGFAWVASSFRREGYGVRMAAADTEDARKFFIERIAKPQRTILHGASFGGLVGVKLLETDAKNADGTTNYDGAFFNSGLVLGTALGYEFRVDLRAVYQYYCKNLPRPSEPDYPLWNGIPADSKMNLKDLETLVDECTGVTKAAATRSEPQKQNLANILGVMGFHERVLYRHMQSSTLLFRDIVQRMMKGRNPFTNLGVRYKGSTDDPALNHDVVRFTADPTALADLRADGEPTGALPVPVISIHSINDPQVVVEGQSVFRGYVNAAGNGERLVQAYTDEPEHTAQSTPELGAALEALMQWIEKGVKPTPQTILATCERLRDVHEGPCRYHPEFEPRSYDTRYYARAAVAR